LPGKLTTVTAGPYTRRGISVAGVHTSIHVRELGCLFDMGIATRGLAGAENMFLSHGHADHSGALLALLGIRGLLRMSQPRIFLPAEIEVSLREALAAFAKLQRYELSVELVPMLPGDECTLRGDLHVRAFRTHHTGPSLGYQFLTRVPKLKQAFHDLPGHEIALRRKRGDPIFDFDERPLLAYATDTLPHVLDTTPSLLDTRVLILECSFLDERKSISASRAGGHVHLDELLERASTFQNEALVLMHFSQMYAPAEVHRILGERCPPELLKRLVVFAPPSGPWPGGAAAA
jgi:ribonuclease Z